ncbi:uncharacterized protein [Parasteatoda tepidariorum]|uniref:uncharacterized protein n=1 Tax=Parasteatoda tepidariorum TaxID=114398 RepID=UPI0039BC540B
MSFFDVLLILKFLNKNYNPLIHGSKQIPHETQNFCRTDSDIYYIQICISSLVSSLITAFLMHKMMLRSKQTKKPEINIKETDSNSSQIRNLLFDEMKKQNVEEAPSFENCFKGNLIFETPYTSFEEKLERDSISFQFLTDEMEKEYFDPDNFPDQCTSENLFLENPNTSFEKTSEGTSISSQPHFDIMEHAVINEKYLIDQCAKAKLLLEKLRCLLEHIKRNDLKNLRAVENIDNNMVERQSINLKDVNSIPNCDFGDNACVSQKAGVRIILSELRSTFWILRGRQAIKQVIHKCLPCKLSKAKYGKQIEAPLPPERVVPSAPFTTTGIDFAGPVNIRCLKSRDTAYITLFTCATTRALHIELVSDLTTDKFLLALQRFVGRRGLPHTIYTDNATTFHAANKDLILLWQVLSSAKTQQYYAQNGITWKFIAPRAAWWGGWWERLIGVVKRCLRKVLGRALLDEEGLSTALIGIEAALNSRPLIYEDDSSTALTPSHFLTGRKLTAIPSSPNNNTKLRKFYKQQQDLLDCFWKKWSKEYLLQLRSFHQVRNQDNIINIRIGDIVLLQEDARPRHMWKKARVVNLHEGRDGKIRSCKLRVNGRNITRPEALVIPLEIDQELSSYSPTFSFESTSASTKGNNIATSEESTSTHFTNIVTSGESTSSQVTNIATSGDIISTHSSSSGTSCQSTQTDFIGIVTSGESTSSQVTSIATSGESTSSHFTNIETDESTTTISTSDIDKTGVFTNTKEGKEENTTLTTAMPLINEATAKKQPLVFIVLGTTFLLVLVGATLSALTYKRLRKSVLIAMK